MAAVAMLLLPHPSPNLPLKGGGVPVQTKLGLIQLAVCRLRGLDGDDIGPALCAVLPERQLAVLFKQIRRQDGGAAFQADAWPNLCASRATECLVEIRRIVVVTRSKSCSNSGSPRN